MCILHIYIYIYISWVALVVKNLPASRRHGFNPWFRKIPGGGHDNPLQDSCLQNPHGQRSLADYSPWGHKELDATEATEHAHIFLYLLFWV